MSAEPTKEKAPQGDKKDEQKDGETKKEVEKPQEIKPVTVEEGQFIWLECEQHTSLTSISSHSTEILNNITLIGRAVSTIEPRFTARVLRTLTTLRRRLTKNTMKSVLNQAFPKGCKCTSDPCP